MFLIHYNLIATSTLSVDMSISSIENIEKLDNINIFKVIWQAVPPIMAAVIHYTVQHLIIVTMM